MKRRKYVILAVMDGLRRDLVTQEHTPNTLALQREGIWFTDVRTVFPSVTRVVSSSIATGTSPTQHGLFGNSVALFEDGGYHLHNVGEPSFLPYWHKLRGRTLLMPTLAQRLAPFGETRVFSNVSPGAAYLQDPDNYGFVYHRAGCFGPNGKSLKALDGIDKGEAGDAALTELCLSFLEGTSPPPLSVLWLSEPDHSGHHNPLGSPAYYAGLRAADACIGKVWRSLLSHPEDDWLLLLCSDHGQETETECVNVTRVLVEAGLKEDIDSHELVVAPNGSAGLVYLTPSCKVQASAVCNFFTSQWWCGDIRLYPRHMSHCDDGIDTPAFYFSMAKSSQPNPYGIPGATASVYDLYDPKERIGFGTHGGLGTYEQSPFLLMCGSNIREQKTVSGPVSLLDIAPKILAHFGCISEQPELSGISLENLNLV